MTKASPAVLEKLLEYKTTSPASSYMTLVHAARQLFDHYLVKEVPSSSGHSTLRRILITQVNAAKHLRDTLPEDTSEGRLRIDAALKVLCDTIESSRPPGYDDVGIPGDLPK